MVVGIALAAWPQLIAQSDPGYKVVVHPDNPASSLTRKYVSNLFHKKVDTWPDNVPVQAIDHAPRSPVRAAFSESIHRRAVRNILAYWQRQIFAGRNTPPPEAKSDMEILTWVRENRGGIGYVSRQAPTDGVSVVTISELEGP